MDTKLLLVDDEEGIRTVLGISLADLGYQIYTGADGQQGLQLFRQHNPEIVITDIKMPVMDGVELLKKIKYENPDTEVIVLTGHGDMDLAIQCLKLEAVDFVTKPVDDDILQIALKRANDKISMRRQLRAYTENLERLVEEKSAQLVAVERKNAVGQALEGFTAAMLNIADDLGEGLGYFNDLPCFVSLHGPDLTIVAANENFISRLGDQTGRASAGIYKPTASGEPKSPAQETFQAGKGLRTKAIAINANGSETQVMVYTAPIRGADGQINLVVEIAADVSEIQRLQHELDTSRQRYQHLFNEAPCYITVQDRNLHITAANRRFQDDFSPKGQYFCYETYQQRQEACENCPVLMTFNDGLPHQRELDVKSAKSGPRRMLVWTSPLRDGKGQITHVMEMATDVTQIRQLQDQLAHLGSVIGSLSHGIKGLLTGLDGGMYLLDSGFAKDNMPRIKEGWDLVRLMIGRIRSMVGEMLAYAKGEDIPWDKMDALSLAQDLEAIHRSKTDRAKIDLECQFDPDLKHFHVDVAMARAIMSNILDNALEACQTDPDPAKKHVIRFTAQGKEDGILFKVIDNGPGMEADMQIKIFTPHFLSNKENGSGLGLYLAQRILEQNQGRITVDSTIGQGACFSVYLPRINPRGRGFGHNSPAA